MKNIFILLFSVFVFACSSNAQIKNVSVTEFEKGITELDENEVLLDVRSKQETKAGYIEGMKNIDFYDTQFEHSIDLLDKSKTYYIFLNNLVIWYNIYKFAKKIMLSLSEYLAL